ncbi:MFS transporter [Sinorhizobium americanum]|uniref:Multidrug resistance protein B n=1 Tax=Sinorhizobium americanum TaxID=194963 RepID=A0A1L3LTE8_9HYPH|nr:MFS transporter [Sinorhizobium americanum]APG93369.1 multidrug resistance protein B [Sinorhizobium americanum]OAP50088.1 MFS transporter [Sinorhizobium americanum]
MECKKQRLNYVLFLIAGSGLVTIARAMTLSFLAIKLQQSFGLGPAMIGALLGAGPLVGAIAAPFAGSLSDRAGRKTVLKLTLLSIAFALVGMGLAETVLAFCLAQIVASVAVAIYEPISRALMSDVCPERVRLKYFSWRYTASNVGWAVGPLIGIAVGAASTTLFIIAGIVYATFAVALHLLQVPLHRGDVHQASASAVPVFQSIKAAFRDPRLAFFVGGGMLLIAVYGQWSATLAPYLSDNVAGGVEIFAYLVSINGAVVLIGNPFARRFIERAGALNALVIGCVLFLLSEIGFLSSTGFWSLAITMVVFTIGEILVVPSEYLLVDGISNNRNRGSYFGAHSFSTVGNFVGPTLGGVMLGGLGGPGMFLLFAGFAAASAILFAVGTRMPPPTATTQHERTEVAETTPGLQLRGCYAYV